MELTEEIKTLLDLNSLLFDIEEKRDEIKAILRDRLNTLIEKGPENLDGIEYLQYVDLITYSDQI